MTTPDEEVRALKVARQVMMRCVGDEDYDKRLADIARLHPARLAVVEAAKAWHSGDHFNKLVPAVDALLALEKGCPECGGTGVIDVDAPGSHRMKPCGCQSPKEAPPWRP